MRRPAACLPKVAGLIAVNTTMGAAGGGLLAMLVSKRLTGVVDVQVVVMQHNAGTRVVMQCA
jgi:hypothetical protein